MFSRLGVLRLRHASTNPWPGQAVGQPGLRAAAVAALVLVLAQPFVAPDSQGSVPVPPPAPDLAELGLLHDLSVWVGAGGSAVGLATGLPASIRQRPSSFDVFRSFNAPAAERLLAAMPYGKLIHLAARDAGLDPLLLAAMVETESGFRPTAISHKGAVGLMQLLPETAALFGIQDLASPRENLRGGARYLRHLLEVYDGDLELAVAAYNAGPGAVGRYGGVPPYRETRHYVQKVLGRYVALHRRLWQASEMAEVLVTASGFGALRG